MSIKAGYVFAAACFMAVVAAGAAAGMTQAGKPTVAVPLVVSANDFALTAAPTSRTVVKGKSGSYGITIRPGAGFTSMVTLSVTGLPSGATGSFSVNPAPPSTTVPATSTSTLTVAVAATTAVGTYTLTIKGVSGALSHTATVTLVVTAPVPDFTIHASPTSRTVIHGKSGSYGVTIRPVNGFTSMVTLSVTGLPSGATGSFSVNPAPPSTTVPATSTSTLTVATSVTTPLGTYTLTIKGVSGALSHTSTVTLVVS